MYPSELGIGGGSGFPAPIDIFSDPLVASPPCGSCSKGLFTTHGDDGEVSGDPSPEEKTPIRSDQNESGSIKTPTDAVHVGCSNQRDLNGNNALQEGRV